MTAYTITLTTKTGNEISNTLVEADNLDRAIEIANAQHDTILEGHGLLTAWTVYTAEDGRFMAGWLPEGYATPAGTILAAIANL